MWKCRLGSAGTYKSLIQGFMNAGRLDYAKFVCSILKDIGASGELTSYPQVRASIGKNSTLIFVLL